MERHVCQFQIVSTEGFTPGRCGGMCANRCGLCRSGRLRVKYPAVAPPRLPRFLACLEGTREDPVLWLIELARALPVQVFRRGQHRALEPDGQYFRSMKISAPDCHSSCRSRVTSDEKQNEGSCLQSKGPPR